MNATFHSPTAVNHRHLGLAVRIDFSEDCSVNFTYECGVNFAAECAVNYAVRPKAVEIKAHGSRSSTPNLGSGHFFCSRSRQKIR
jgi:hypothetical protein